MSLLAVVLVCASTVAAPDCTRATALDVRIVGSMPTPFPCLMGSMMTLAREGEAVTGAYGKIVCERRKG